MTAAPLETLAESAPRSGSTHSDLLLQRKCACGTAASSMTDECEECTKKLLQTKLAVGTVHDAGRGHRHHFIGDEGDRETEGSVA